jgi:hypothetical protein
MRVLIHPSSKRGVTRVTRVAHLANRLNSLAFIPVTRFCDIQYSPCNAVLLCNARTSPHLLQVDVLRSRLKRDSRWLCLQNAGRGIERYTMRERLNNDS